jgi:hypothetical protein
MREVTTLLLFKDAEESVHKVPGKALCIVMGPSVRKMGGPSGKGQVRFVFLLRTRSMTSLLIAVSTLSIRADARTGSRIYKNRIQWKQPMIRSVNQDVIVHPLVINSMTEELPINYCTVPG